MEHLTPKALTIAHAQPNWLPVTMTWLHNQVRSLDDEGLRNVVLAERTENLASFGDVDIKLPTGQHSLFRIRDMIVRKLKLRRYLRYHLTSARFERVDLLHSPFRATMVGGI